MTSPLEIAANFVNAVSIILAGRNSVHTWWTGIIGCLLFGMLFYYARLYADVTLQLFFIITSVSGWWHWRHGKGGGDLPVRDSQPRSVLLLALGGLLVALVYGWLLYRFTNAYAPYIDSLVLAFSVLGQFLLMGRRIETWWCWLVVNTISVPLYCSRGLYLTAGLYVLFWINAAVSLRVWRREVQTA
ncbi:MAG: nicotinamide mononucleotide transporter [Geobacteraceae bacterium GWC2_55_20]|nr:MAG: nicotinamide mononucleotide transporter [Geobacteraceae bacterium GWC2_55_20]HCE68003.1 nicotinamide mononucleotide transporter [Geobacter sp.]